MIGELDSGMQYTHPDLAANVWTNPGGIGGCARGTHGFDALDNSCDPNDEDETYGGHGTHVAGIMGALGDNGIGVAGVNWQTTIMPVKWVRSAGIETDDLLGALRWIARVKDEGVNVRVVNDSLTFYGTPYSSEVKQAIEALGARGILFVTAAGNSGDDDDEEAVRRYPCGYQLANELCVTATNNRDELPWWANYGPRTVDLAAPGVSIYSTLREDRYGYLSGGSMAAAQVSGAAALVLSAEPGLSVAALRQDLLDSVDVLPSLHGKVLTGGRLDICRALPRCEGAPPPDVQTLPADELTSHSARLNASVDPDGEEVSDCQFEYGTSTAYGHSAACAPAPGDGSDSVRVSAVINGLAAGSTYHFRIVADSATGHSAGGDLTLQTAPEEAPHEEPPPEEPPHEEAPHEEAPAREAGPGHETSGAQHQGSGSEAPNAAPAGQPGASAGAAPVPVRTPPGLATDVAPTTAARALLAGRALEVSGRGAVRVAIECPLRGEACTGTLSLRMDLPWPRRLARTRPKLQAGEPQRLVTIALGSFSVAPGRFATVTLSVSRRALAVLAGGRRRRAWLVLEQRTPQLLQSSAEVTLSLLAAMREQRPATPRRASTT